MEGTLRTSILLLIFFFKSVISLERTDRLLINSDPQTFQEQISHLTQELNTLRSDANREISYLKAQLATQNQQISVSRGSTFIVWGKKSCPVVNGTELVYNGIAGGGQYNEDGDGANTLCLPHDPQQLLVSISVAENDDYAHLYGSEYRLNIQHVHSKEDVPCAVCRTHIASSIIMVPGKHTCPEAVLGHLDSKSTYLSNERVPMSARGPGFCGRFSTRRQWEVVLPSEDCVRSLAVPSIRK